MNMPGWSGFGCSTQAVMENKMADDINMDTNKKKEKEGPQLEFTLPANELLDQFRVGEIGRITIPVEVIQAKDGSVTFRKRGEAQTDGSFSQTTAAEMKKNLPVAER